MVTLDANNSTELDLDEDEDDESEDVCGLLTLMLVFFLAMFDVRM